MESTASSGPSLNFASFEQALKNLNRKLRFRRDPSGIDDSDDDSDAAPSTTDLMYEHVQVHETKNGPRWAIDHTFEGIAADPLASVEVQREVSRDSSSPAPGTPSASMVEGSSTVKSSFNWRDQECPRFRQKEGAPQQANTPLPAAAPSPSSDAEMRQSDVSMNTVNSS